MPIPPYTRLLAVFSLALSACQSAAQRSVGAPVPINPPTTDAAVAASIEWWRAFAESDTAALREQSASAVTVTLSNGQSFNHAEMIAESQRFAASARPVLEWSDTLVVRSADGRTAVVTARLRETNPRGVTYNRTLSVLERVADAPRGWRLLAAQGTRELQRYARIPASAAGELTAYAGQYRVPNGAIKVTVVDSALALTDPRGAVTRLEPVGPALFEAVPPPGVTEIVRLLFSRDETGKISSVSRLSAGTVTTFARILER